jgi:hypothetical protein
MFASIFLSSSDERAMTDKPLPKDEPGAQQRFDRAIKNALATPPTPHKPKEGKESKGSAKLD